MLATGRQEGERETGEPAPAVRDPEEGRKIRELALVIALLSFLSDY